MLYARHYGFYGVIAAATLIGLLIDFTGVNLIKVLIVSAVINGVVAVPLIYFVAKIAGRGEIMGEFKSGWLSNILVWMTFIAMAVAAIAMFATLG